MNTSFDVKTDYCLYCDSPHDWHLFPGAANYSLACRRCGEWPEAKEAWEVDQEAWEVDQEPNQ